MDTTTEHISFIGLVVNLLLTNAAVALTVVQFELAG